MQGITGILSLKSICHTYPYPLGPPKHLRPFSPHLLNRELLPCHVRDLADGLKVVKQLHLLGLDEREVLAGIEPGPQLVAQQIPVALAHAGVTESLTVGLQTHVGRVTKSLYTDMV